MHDPLFRPIQINSLPIQNRIFLPAMHLNMADQGHKVVLVEMLERIGQDIGKSTRWTMLQELRKLGVKVKTKTRAVAIEQDGVVVDKDGEETKIPADCVVLALGSRPYNPLQENLLAKGLDCRVVGDAQKIGQAIDAVHAGFALGREIE